MRYGSVCSGIEAASCAWRPLGWKPAFFSEIEAFPSAVLKHHHLDVPNRGDMTRFKEWPHDSIDLLVGGTPCQSFSVAGLRKGMADPRGNLALVFLALADRLRPRWVVWENVPGVLSQNEGRDFASIVGGLGQLGYGWAYRVLDAQYFGVPQRRRRVFLVGHLGDWRRAAAVLFERQGLSWDPPPSRQAGQGTAPGAAAGARNGGYLPDAAAALNAHGGPVGRLDAANETFVAHALTGEGHDASEDGSGRGTPITLAVRGRAGGHDLEIRQDGTANAIITPNGGRAGIGVGAIAFTPNDSGDDAAKDLAPTLRSGSGGGRTGPAIAFDTTQITHPENRCNPQPGDPCHPLAAQGHPPAITVAPALTTNDPSRSPQAAEVTQQVEAVHRASMAVRRLTPRECERLQGFPDDYTLITFNKKPAADGPRYKALGNSMAVTVMNWIGRRIEAVDGITRG